MLKNIALCIKMSFGVMICWFGYSPFDIVQIDIKSPSAELLLKLKNFESSFSYPFSDTEEFRIEHGINGDYFAFFKTLGKPYYFVATNKHDKKITKIIDGNEIVIEQKAGEIAGVACGILRTMKKNDGKSVPAWYICDLKVGEKYQGEHLPLIIAQTVALKRFFQCSRGFGICMNPPQGEPKAAHIFKKHGPIKGLQTRILNLYSLTAKQVHRNFQRISDAFRKYGYLKKGKAPLFKSTQGIKDYQIFDKKNDVSRPWNLVHLQYGQPNNLEIELQDDSVYMICSVEGTLLDNDFKQILGLPSSTAQIVSYGMEDVDFNFLTSNQI